MAEQPPSSRPRPTPHPAAQAIALAGTRPALSRDSTAGAVPGEFVPGARDAFLTSALLTVLALIVALTLIRRPRAARGLVPVVD